VIPLGQMSFHFLSGKRLFAAIPFPPGRKN
jgi:hypothetical protein